MPYCKSCGSKFILQLEEFEDGKWPDYCSPECEAIEEEWDDHYRSVTKHEAS